jgi:hypothetical protein
VRCADAFKWPPHCAFILCTFYKEHKTASGFVRFKDFTAMAVTISWDVIPWSRDRSSLAFCHQSWSASQANKLATSSLQVTRLTYSSTHMTEAVCASRMLNFYQTSRYHIPEATSSSLLAAKFIHVWGLLRWDASDACIFYPEDGDIWFLRNIASLCYIPENCNNAIYCYERTLVLT